MAAEPGVPRPRRIHTEVVTRSVGSLPPHGAAVRLGHGGFFDTTRGPHGPNARESDMAIYLTGKGRSLETVAEAVAYRNNVARRIRGMLDHGQTGRELVDARNEVHDLELALEEAGCTTPAPAEAWQQMPATVG